MLIHCENCPVGGPSWQPVTVGYSEIVGMRKDPRSLSCHCTVTRVTVKMALMNQF